MTETKLVRELALPDTLEETQALHKRLVAESQRIENAITDRNKTGPDGERLSDKEYWAWRSRAKFALAAIRKEQRRVKDHLIKLHAQRGEAPGRDGYSPALKLVAEAARCYLDDLDTGGDTAESLADLRRALAHLNKLRADGVAQRQGQKW